ncbi:MAG: adenosylmethionine--8-amino-7-oxononanoate transaminase [Bacteroidetes bacterium]|nr:adenosylmethionine--8-amino-7-oxononanoate transaminase [Bacteroidota bacterium]
MNLQDRDRKHIWHPLTQHQTAKDPIGIVKAKGALLWDENGKEYIDGIASWYTTMYGHCNDHIIAAVSEQMQTLDFTMFTGFTHEPAVRLSEKLMEILPENQAKIFFNDNGSTAVEAAIKMALQFFHNRGERRDTLIAFEDGFHGDTFGAMSASGISSYNGPFEDFLLKVVRLPVPQEHNKDRVLALLKTLLQQHQCAAFIFEPLVQGAAGMKFHDAGGLDALIQLCKETNVLTIADEIMTGFGKTGRNFASDFLAHKPDIMCLSKALTAGMFPLSITSCSQDVFEGFLSEAPSKGFFHAHTFSAHPLGCAAAIAGIDLMLSKGMQENQARIKLSHEHFAKVLSTRPKALNVRVKGVILAFELDNAMDRYGSQRNQLYQFFIDKGFILRPLGNTIYLLPPYVITNKELNKLYDTILEVVN